MGVVGVGVGVGVRTSDSVVLEGRASSLAWVILHNVRVRRKACSLGCVSQSDTPACSVHRLVVDGCEAQDGPRLSKLVPEEEDLRNVGHLQPCVGGSAKRLSILVERRVVFVRVQRVDRLEEADRRKVPLEAERFSLLLSQRRPREEGEGYERQWC